jgi:hypothetical protein
MSNYFGKQPSSRPDPVADLELHGQRHRRLTAPRDVCF